MIENSISQFIDNYKEFAMEGTIFPNREGSFLIEFLCNKKFFYLIDRTGPYLETGKQKVIINITIQEIDFYIFSNEEIINSAINKYISSKSLGIQGIGEIISINNESIIIEAEKIYLVASFLEKSNILEKISIGNLVKFKSFSMIFGFVLQKNNDI